MRPAQRNMYGQPAGMRYSASPSHLHPPLQPGHGRGHALSQGLDQAHSHMQQHSPIQPRLGRGHALSQGLDQAHSHMQPQLYSSMPSMGIPIGNAGIPFQYDYTPSSAAREASQQPWSASFLRTSRPQWEPRVDLSGPSWQESGPFMNPNAYHTKPLHAYHILPESSEDRAFGNVRSSDSGMGRGRGIFGGRHVSMSKDPHPFSCQSFEAPPVVVLQAKSLRCEPCEKTFDVLSQMKAHMSSHVLCDEPSCSFSASGKMVKEHKQMVHGKKNASLSVKAIKDAALCSKESEDEVRRWREERKRNYPTTSNIKRKAEDRQGRKARGELMDEDARLRRQRLKEVLQRQAELGVPVAEIPSYYISDRYGRDHSKLSSNNQNGAENVAPAQNTLSNQTATQVNGVKRGCSPRAETYAVLGSGALSDLSNQKSTGIKPTHRTSEQPCYFFQRGRCKKGSRCHFVHDRQQRRKGGEERANMRGKDRQKGASSSILKPSLLSKLLDSSIRADKSRILECLRFFVKNSFLLEWPTRPLEFSNWLEEDVGGNIPEQEASPPLDVLAADAALVEAIDVNEVEIEEVDPGNWEPVTVGQPESSNEEM
ncbi:hypothetical protein CY35_10G063400 [Sphagnum magellanicum]|nr:hypothetical protein CY35_10G063400 [Sphagnum magellanicum]KAH9550271.1 hypothetical protein CY35_10G063400 [Sphagnum magellanicum]